MSHLVEEYAKHLGVKISKPIVSKHFLPITFDKYITVCLDHEVDSKNYKYYETVLDIIKRYLDVDGTKIIQIGSSKSPKLDNVDARLFDLNFKNAAYVISKSKLHVGVDNTYSHYASSINVPLVTIFGNVYANISCGYWGKNKINIEAPWKVKPSLSSVDAHDSINKIEPEKIAVAILKQLSINVKNSLSTKFIGDFYANKVTEIVPNFFSPIVELKKELVFIRLDYGFDQKSFYHWLQFLNAYSIFSKDLLPIEFCKQFSQKIKNISYIIDKNTKIEDEYLKSLQSMNISFTFLVEDAEQLAELRNKFFEYPVHLYFKANKDMLPEDCRDFSNLYFNSSKVILADNEKYLSKYHWLQKKKLVDKNFNLEDNDTLLEELNHFYVYTTTN
jgi:hypothetical protein